MCLKQKLPILYNMSIMLFQKKMMNESDWKIFTKIKDKALEKYCSNCFAEFRDIIDDTNKETHEKYLLHYKTVIKRDKEMGSLFDGHSRSKAWLQLLAIRGAGLADEKLISQLTDEFCKSTDPDKFK